MYCVCQNTKYTFWQIPQYKLEYQLLQTHRSIWLGKFNFQCSHCSDNSNHWLYGIAIYNLFILQAFLWWVATFMNNSTKNDQFLDKFIMRNQLLAMDRLLCVVLCCLFWTHQQCKEHFTGGKSICKWTIMYQYILSAFSMEFLSFQEVLQSN